MKIIHFISNKFYTTVEQEKTKIPLTLEDGRTVYRDTPTGIIKNVNKHSKEYWIPENEIKILSHQRDTYKINDIEVSKEEFEKVLKQLQGE